MRSYWESTAWVDADVAIIGGGIIGMNTAIELATRHPEWRVVVLERGVLPSGASTRNAGFACVGSLSEIASDIDLMGPDAAASLVEQRMRGLALLAERCGGADIGYAEDGGSEIFPDHHASLGRLNEVNDLLRPLFGHDVFHERRDLIAGFALASTLHTLIHTPFEGTLHSGKLMQHLWSLARQRGVDIRTGTEVRALEADASGVRLEVHSVRHTVGLRAARVVVATNAMIPTLLPDAALPEILPGRGQVIVTAPIANLRLRGSFHADEGYYYFRALGDRVLLGGGRNLDFDGERTTSHETTAPIQSALETMLRTVILPNVPDLSIDHRWAGTMAFTSTKQPHVGFVNPTTIVAFGCNGMGVALSSVVARQAADLIA
jgi:glycine/D-amino acid oxidase-like deaminating enzyme